MDQGLALGLSSYSQTVSNTAGKVVANAVDTAEKGALALSNAIGFNDVDQPVIRPVLDLSDVQNGAKSLNSMFNSRALNATHSISMAGYIANHQKAMNDTSETKYDDTYTKELTLAIDRLNERMGTISEDISNMKVYLDGDVLAGHMTPRIDRNLGAASVLAGRMN